MIGGCNVPIVIAKVLEFPLVHVPLEHVAVKVVFAEILTFTEFPVIPFDQLTIPVHPVPVNVTLPDSHIVKVDAVMVGAEPEPMTVISLEPVAPQAPAQVAE
jgi:hypothetical protein